MVIEAYNNLSSFKSSR